MSINLFLGDGKVTAYLVEDIDEGLGIAFLKRTGENNHLTREDHLDKQGEFTLRNRAADQTLQSLFTRGWAVCWRQRSRFAGCFIAFR